MTGVMHLEAFEEDGKISVKCQTELRHVTPMDQAAIIDSVLDVLELDWGTAFILVRKLHFNSTITRVDGE